MIHLWLLVVQTFQIGDRLDLFSTLTKPANPISSETKDYPTILDSLLFTSSNNWQMDEEQILENMDKIAFHESKGIVDAIQQSNKTKSGIGPGRGLFQFEKNWGGKQRGAHTAMNRLINEYDKREMNIPDWVYSIEMENYDVSRLSKEQQEALLLANILQTPNKGEGYVPASFKGVDTDEELAHWWAQYHQAGTKPGTKEYKKMINKFLKDMKYYNK